MRNRRRIFVACGRGYHQNRRKDSCSPSHHHHHSRCHLADQSGCSLLPDLVNCLRSLPVRAIVKICFLPARVDVNAMWRPLGANAGLSFEPSPNVNWRTSRVDMSITLMSLPGPVFAVYAISLYGEGDQVGLSA